MRLDPVRQLVLGHRPRDGIALDMAASKLCQKRMLALRLDALGQRFQTKPLGQGEDRGDQVLLPPVAVVVLMQRWFIKGLTETEK